MKRRSSAGGKPAKPRGPKRSTPKRRNAPKTTRDRGVSVAGQETVVARLTHERDEALLRETANSEILRLISKSPGDLELVFRTILENATRICNANFGTLFRFDGENFYPAAQFNTPAALLEATERRGSFKPTPGSGVSLYHVMRTKQVFHRADMAAEPVLAFSTKFGGARSQITVPMLKDDALIGAIVIYRQEVRPFTDKQIALVENFAAQAVIAIENARLLNELRESLGQQTATADVLKVISSSPGELDPVFNAMLENATRLCEAKFGVLYLFENGKFCPVALVGASPEWQTYVKERGAFVPTPDQPMRQMKETRRVVQAFADTESTASIAAFRFGGARVFIAVPMLKDGELVGAIAIFRQEARPFAEKQIELVTTFADQAVIAIENARLLNELRQRTADLSESLEQQTATSEVLNVINSSPGEVESVFQATLENATRLCEAKFGVIFYYREGAFHPAAELNTPTAYSEFIRQRGSFPPASGSTFEHLVRTKQVINIVDAAAQGPFSSNAAAKFGGARSQISVPMLKEDELIGAIAIYRQHVLPFTDKQIELVKNFAAQAVIAIENARLLNELRGSLERQTATSEVLGVISKSAGDLEPVYQAILENAARICEAQFGILTLHENGALRMGAMHNVPTAFAEWLQEQRGAFKPIEGSQPDRVLRTKQISYTADAAAVANPGRAARLGGARSTVCVPMLKDEELVGTITIYRQEVRPFTDKQIELLQNFAAQAVIAIENARLLDDLNKLNQQLEQRVADQVGEIERMGRLRRFLPPQVADLIVTSGTEKQLESHRREITALFCDLRGFTGFSESSDPEDVMALLRDYHAAIGQIIIKYSGTLERYAGDGVMVVFNDPVPVENPALQAVLMALEMRNAIGALTETWHRLGHDIGFGIGIAHGFATLGTIGFEGRFDYAAIGTVSNVASRLCDEAKPGQILINSRVLTKVENAVTVEPVGEFTLKGIRRPMTAYNVLAPSPSKPN